MLLLRVTALKTGAFPEQETDQGCYGQDRAQV